MPRAVLLLLACCLPALAPVGSRRERRVRVPGSYAVTDAPSISQLLRAAGGLSVQAGAAAVLRLADSPTIVITSRLQTTAAGLRVEPDTALTSGDRLFVPAAGAEAEVIGVQVEGFVRRPGAYPLPLGSRLGDLLQAAGGLLPLANPQARLRRQGGEVPVDLRAAAQAQPTQDPMLSDGDVLEVGSNAALLAAAEARVTVSGEVARPGIYPRYQGMRLSDLLRTAGGLSLGADRDRIWLERLTNEGRVRRIPIAPLSALAGRTADDLVLADGDGVRVPGLPTIRPGAEPVTVAGEVHYPGSFDLSEGLTAGDLLRLAGGPTPEAWLTRALLTRRGTDGRARQVAIDLTRQPLTLPLAAGDMLEVLPLEQAIYREPTVVIRGDVRYGGSYERTLGMRLSDLIWIAGGLTRNIAFGSCEISRARERSVTILQPDLEQVMAQVVGHDVELVDGDVVFIRTLGELRGRVPEVHLHGAVRRPGSYPMQAEQIDLREALERAGGLAPDADPRGAMLLRRVDQLVHPDVARYVVELYTSFIRRRMVALYGQAASRMLLPEFGSIEDGLTRPLQPIDPDLAVALAGSSERLLLPRDAELIADRDRLAAVMLDDQGRPYPPAKPRATSGGYFRIAIDLPAVLAGEQEALLLPDDLLIIPRPTQTVLVMGEVASQQPLLHMAGASVAEYLQLCGGVTRDGDRNDLLRIMPSGAVERATPRTVPERGDVLVVMPVRYDSVPDSTRLIDIAKGLARHLRGLATYLLTLSK